SAVRGETDHQVVQSRMRNKIKLLQQGSSFAQMMINTLYQQRPVTLWPLGKALFRKRSILKLPVNSSKPDQARLHILFAGQAGKLVCIKDTLEFGDGLTYQQWFFLPVLF